MIVRLAISAAILAYLATRIDMAEATRATAAVSLPHLFLVLAMVAADRAVMILRWILLLRASGTPVSTPDATRLFLISSFVGSFMPAGVGADAVRAYGLSRGAASSQASTSAKTTVDKPSPTTQVPASEALASVAVDRLLGITALVLLAVLGGLAWTPPGGADWRIAAAIVAALTACVAVFWANEWMRWLIPAHHHEGFVARRLLRLTDAVGRYRGRRGVLIHVLLWSVAVQVLRISQAYILGLGLGMTVPFSYFLLFMPPALLVLSLPISISGFGLPQGAIVWMLQPMGVPESQSFALSMLIVLTGLAGNVPGLYLWLRKSSRI